jgi:citrate synthase
MLRGEPPTPAEERAMDLIMLLLAEHGFNASTFTARVTASTLSDMYSAITSAIGTLKGSLHGGANQRAMEMLLEIGDEENVERYITEALVAKKRIMGFGHRVYKTIDPRAIYLRDMACALEAEAENPHWCHLSLRVEETVEAKKKGIYPNVDFFSAPLLYTLGVPLSLFTPIFAISRVIGWTAHVMEQYEDNRLIRPLSNYVGPAQRSYVPIAER